MNHSIHSYKPTKKKTIAFIFYVLKEKKKKRGGRQSSEINRTTMNYLVERQRNKTLTMKSMKATWHFARFGCNKAKINVKKSLAIEDKRTLFREEEKKIPENETKKDKTREIVYLVSIAKRRSFHP